MEQQIKAKIEKAGTPLKDWEININYGIKTGYNEAFIIDDAKRKELIESDPRSAEIIRPILRGRDIKRYGFDFANFWLLNVHNGIKEKGIKPVNVDDYLAIKRHLIQYYPNLEKRLDKGNTPFNLRNCAYTEDFFRQKIIWGEISDKTKFSIDLAGEFIPEATTFLMTGNSLLYLLGFLNSRLSEYLFGKIGTTTGVGTVRWKKFTIERLQVPKISKDKEKVYNEMVLNIIENQKKGKDINHLVKAIDDMIYKQFDFTDEEIKVISES